MGKEIPSLIQIMVKRPHGTLSKAIGWEPDGSSGTKLVPDRPRNLTVLGLPSVVSSLSSLLLE